MPEPTGAPFIAKVIDIRSEGRLLRCQSQVFGPEPEPIDDPACEPVIVFNVGEKPARTGHVVLVYPLAYAPTTRPFAQRPAAGLTPGYVCQF